MDIINGIEERFPVDEWKLSDIRIWPLIRVTMGMNMLSTERNFSNETYSSSIRQKIEVVFQVFFSHWHFLKSYILDFKNNQSRCRKSSIIILGNTCNRRLKIKNKWFDIYSDPFIVEFNKRGKQPFVLEAAKKNRYCIPRFSKSVYVQTAFDGILFISRIYNLLRPKVETYLPRYYEANTFVENNTVSSIGLPDPHILQRWVSHMILLKGYYKSWLKKTGAGLMMQPYFYCLEGMAWNLACRELNIPSVDIQHGVAGELHFAYGRWKKVPEDGFELLPSIFWSWVDEDGQAICDWSGDLTKYHRAIVGGNLLVKLWQQNFGGIDSANRGKIQKIQGGMGEKKAHILVTLQEEKFPYLLEKTIKENKDWMWWIRVHPSSLDYMKTLRESLQHLKNIDVENASILPLFSLLNIIDVHVTGWSAVVFDAKSFGIPSIVTAEKGRDWFQKEIESGWCRFADSESKLQKEINELLHFKQRKNSESVKDRSDHAIVQLLKSVKQKG